MEASDPREAIVRFAAYLREHGFAVGFDELALMQCVAADIPPGQSRTLEPAWRSLVAGNRRQWERFPALFSAFWFPHRMRGSTRVVGTRPCARTLPEQVAALHDQLSSAVKPSDSQGRNGWAAAGSDESGESESSPRAMGGASRSDPGDTRPFAEWAPQEIERIEPLITAFARRLRRLLLRRREVSRQHDVLDLRACLRAAHGTGGELIRLAWRRHATRRPRVVVMVDVSRSMERHAPFFMRVAKVFGDRADARIFVFHTRIAEVTAMLRRPGARMQERINAVSFTFGGGTRIASTLEQALDGPLRGYLGRSDLVMICSDGFDADPPERLPLVLDRVNALGSRIVWLHPTREPPASLAMQAAFGTIRTFVPVYDVNSLARLPGVI